jgi:predicted amidohydrolase
MLRAGTFQGPSVKCDFASVFAIIDSTLSDAAKQELDIVQFPELYLCGYDISLADVVALAVPQGGAELAALGALAAKHGVAFGIGYAERADGDDTHIYNSCCVFDSAGSIVLNYRKTHLWDPTLEGEKINFRPGDDLPVGRLFLPREGVTIDIGVLICFDCEFPEPARVLALKGATVILICTAICDDATPRVMIPCRAAENHAILIYSNLTGIHSRYPSSLNGSEGVCASADSSSISTCFCGQSAIIAPNGDELVRASRADTGLFAAAVDPAAYAAHKSRNDYLQERRPELYGALMKT